MAFYNKEKRGGFGSAAGNGAGGKKFGDRSDRGGFGKGRGGFDRDRGGSGGGGGFRGARAAFGRNSGPATMFDAVCSECGRECQVPFRPNGRKPVLCSNCFDKQKNSGGDRPSRNFDRPRFGDRTERPDRAERPPHVGGIVKGDAVKLEQKIEVLNHKLDAILDLLKGWEMMEDGADTDEEVMDFDNIDLDDDSASVKIVESKVKKVKTAKPAKAEKKKK